MKKRGFFFAAVAVATFNASAGPIEMAHKAGFTGCDKAISTEMAHYTNYGNGRINIEYDNKRFKNKAISFLTTHGNSGDTVLQKNTFINHGGSCQAYLFGQITTSKNCVQFKEENPVWTYVESQGDNIWTKNSGGVIAVLKSAPIGGCIVSYNRAALY